MQPTSHNFPENADAGLANPVLQTALGLARTGFPLRRRLAIERLPEFEALRDQGKAIKDHTLAHLDFYLERYEAQVTAAGGTVHWARDAEEARRIVLAICRSVGAKIVTKGKSMVAEEIALNDYLEKNGVTPVETDLGEYIIQLRHEPPSHIIAPAIHLMKEQVAEAFRAAHTSLAPDRPLTEAAALCEEARTVLRPQFLAADVGITGANFLIAETGSGIIVTNEGNGDLTQTLPRVHIVMASLEKIVPTLEDAATLLRLLARSATGQEFSSYTTLSTGPRRPGDLDGPEQYHVVLLDNGRTAMLGTEFQDMLRCLRCSACLNHCPVYAAVGGHAYGWVYPGPMGAVLTPALIGLHEAGHLPNASTFCGKCESVCPVKIPLPKMMRHWRERQFAERKAPAAVRAGLGLWAWVARRPGLYHALAEIGSRVLGRAGAERGRFRSLPLAGGWTSVRDMPAPEGRSFHSLWAEREKRRAEDDGMMTASRSDIIGNIRRALKRGPLPPESTAALERRIAEHRRNLVPARATALDDAGRIDLFVAMAEEVQTTVTRVASEGDVPGEVARYLAAENLPARLTMAPDPALDAIPWQERPLLQIRRGRADPADAVSLTPCLAAIAETGTLMLVSGEATPTTLNFLPDTHIVVVRAGQVVAGYEDGWDLLRARTGGELGNGKLPRTVNFVTGPSRTGDIEQRIQLGAHGPRRLHIVLIEGQTAPGHAPPRT